MLWTDLIQTVGIKRLHVDVFQTLTYPFGSGFGEERDLAFAFHSSLCESETDPSRFGRKVRETAPDVLPEDQFPEKLKKLLKI